MTDVISSPVINPNTVMTCSFVPPIITPHIKMTFINSSSVIRPHTVLTCTTRLSAHTKHTFMVQMTAGFPTTQCAAALTVQCPSPVRSLCHFSHCSHRHSVLYSGQQLCTFAAALKTSCLTNPHQLASYFSHKAQVVKPWR